jgi:hypothetical protein
MWVSSNTFDVIRLLFKLNVTSVKMRMLPSAGRKGDLIQYFYWKVLIRASGLCPLTGIIFYFSADLSVYVPPLCLKTEV